MGYEVSRRFEVKVRNLDNYTTFMNALFAMDNTEGISVDFDRTDRERVEFDLIGKATEDARRQATALARGAGAELGPAFALSRYRFAYVSDNFGLGTYFSSMSAVSGPVVLEQAEQLFIPATITFDCTVNVIYELKQP